MRVVVCRRSVACPKVTGFVMVEQITSVDVRPILVKHRELTLLSPRGRTVIVYQPDDSFDVIDLSLVTSLTVSGKGPKKRKRR